MSDKKKVILTERTFRGTVNYLDINYIFFLYETFDGEQPLLKIRDAISFEYLKEDDPLYIEIKEMIMYETDM